MVAGGLGLGPHGLFTDIVACSHGAESPGEWPGSRARLSNLLGTLKDNTDHYTKRAFGFLVNQRASYLKIKSATPVIFLLRGTSRRLFANEMIGIFAQTKE
jgi:hypothetical protein